MKASYEYIENMGWNTVESLARGVANDEAVVVLVLCGRLLGWSTLRLPLLGPPRPLPLSLLGVWS